MILNLLALEKVCSFSYYGLIRESHLLKGGTNLLILSKHTAAQSASGKQQEVRFKLDLSFIVRLGDSAVKTTVLSRISLPANVKMQ
jgi:hypothetical protein